MKAILFSVWLLLANQAVSVSKPSIYKLSATTLDGKNQAFNAYEGKVLLIANIASQCGYTKQLKGIQELHKRYHKKGLRVLGFPSNSFRQEPLKGAKIASFCRLNYGVEFTIFRRSSDTGSNKNPIFDFLVKRLS